MTLNSKKRKEKKTLPPAIHIIYNFVFFFFGMKELNELNTVAEFT